MVSKIKVDEIENSAINHLLKKLPWKRESLEINIYYKGNPKDVDSKSVGSGDVIERN